MEKAHLFFIEDKNEELTNGKLYGASIVCSGKLYGESIVCSGKLYGESIVLEFSRVNVHCARV